MTNTARLEGISIQLIETGGVSYAVTKRTKQLELDALNFQLEKSHDRISELEKLLRNTSKRYPSYFGCRVWQPILYVWKKAISQSNFMFRSYI